MFPSNDNPIDYREFKRRARRFENLRAFAVSFAFDLMLIAMFGGMAFLIIRGSYFR